MESAVSRAVVFALAITVTALSSFSQVLALQAARCLTLHSPAKRDHSRYTQRYPYSAVGSEHSEEPTARLSLGSRNPAFTC